MTKLPRLPTKKQLDRLVRDANKLRATFRRYEKVLLKHERIMNGPFGGQLDMEMSPLFDKYYADEQRVEDALNRVAKQTARILPADMCN